MHTSRQPLHVISGAHDPHQDPEIARLRSEIDARNRQEQAIAELGQAALTGVDPYILLGQACALIEMTLGVGHCRALELTAAGRMVVRASMGTNASFLHCEQDADEDESVETAIRSTRTYAGAKLGNIEGPTEYGLFGDGPEGQILGCTWRVAVIP